MSKKVTDRAPDKITVSCNLHGLKPDGDINLLRVEQGDDVLLLTRDQARSLAKYITVKLGEEGS